MQSQFGPDEGVHVINGMLTSREEAPVFTGYGLDAKEVDPDSAECLAKQSDASTWIKYGTRGADGGKMHNHLSSTFEASRASRVYNASGRPAYEFRRVSKDAFDLYIQFLRTNNPAHLRQAERA